MSEVNFITVSFCMIVPAGPNKGKRWIKDKYFKVIGQDRWVFTDNTSPSSEKLLMLRAVSILRHKKVKSDANPYDPLWYAYFEKRIRNRKHHFMQLPALAKWLKEA